MFEYMTAQEAAEKWNISLRWVQRLCKENRIEGAINFNRVWPVSYTHLDVYKRQVYGRFFKLYLYTAIAPVPLSTFAGEPSQSVGKSFIKSYAAVCLEGAIIVLACIIFSLFAATPPAVDPNLAAVSMVWSYIGELIFNMLVLVGAVKMADRVVREMMGL